MPISAVDAISPAFHHTKQQLFQPFRFWQWARLALVGLMAGEVSSGGGCNSFQVPQMHGGGQRFATDSVLPAADPMLYAGMVALLVVLGVIFWLLLMYTMSVMRFVLFDSVVAKECHIRASWNQRQRPGLRYFGWTLLMFLCMTAGLTILIGIPAGIAFSLGWLKNPSQHMAPLILGGLVLFFLFAAFIIIFLVVMVMTKDFVVPQMALEDIGVIEGWRRLWVGIKTDKGGYAAYIGMKLLMAIGAGMVLGIVAFIVILLILIPLGALGVIAIITGKTAGFTWNAYTITTAVLAGAVCLAIIFYVLALISVPAIVFFPAYAIHFFASRYRPLDAALHPLAQALPVLELHPPAEPPPLPPDFSPSPS
ncbi:MAG TPA: hypothetical protein VH088_14690 [Terriglobales bacterium]|nr:hypothetical protein [Terriglobales bacterium]